MKSLIKNFIKKSSVNLPTQYRLKTKKDFEFSEPCLNIVSVNNTKLSIIIIILCTTKRNKRKTTFIILKGTKASNLIILWKLPSKLPLKKLILIVSFFFFFNSASINFSSDKLLQYHTI